MMVGNVYLSRTLALSHSFIHSDSVQFTTEPDGSVQVDIPFTTQKWAVTLKFEL